MAVRGQLHAVRKATGEVIDKEFRVVAVVRADHPRDDELGICADRRPHT